MKEAPSPFKKMDPEDIASEAFLGHRIEQWDALRDVSIPVVERKQRLISELEKEITALKERREEMKKDLEIEMADVFEAEVEELIADIDEIKSVEETEEALDKLAQSRRKYYMEMLSMYRDEIRKDT